MQSPTRLRSCAIPYPLIRPISETCSTGWKEPATTSERGAGTASKPAAKRTQRQFNLKRSAILEAVPGERKPQAEQLLSQLDTNLEELCASSALQERDGFLEQRRLTLADIGALEELFVGDFPYAIPSNSMTSRGSWGAPRWRFAPAKAISLP